MLTDNDPMKGYYDRVVEKGGENLEIIRGIFKVLLLEFNWDAEDFIRRCSERGYGVDENMRKIIYGENHE